MGTRKCVKLITCIIQRKADIGVQLQRRHEWLYLMCKKFPLRDAHACTPARAGVEGTLLSTCMPAPGTGMAGDAIGVTATDSAFSDFTKAASFAELKCNAAEGALFTKSASV